MDSINLIRKIKRDLEKKRSRNVSIQASKRMQDTSFLHTSKNTTKTQPKRSLDDIIASLDRLEKKAERDDAFKKNLEVAISKQREELDNIADKVDSNTEKLDQLIDDWNNL